MAKLKDNLLIKLLIAVVIGIILGVMVGEGPIEILLTIKYIVGQFIFFCVPLVVIGFIAPAITSLKSNASKMLIVTLAIAYTSSVGAALLSTVSGYAIIPHLNIPGTVEGLRELPEILFQLDIPPIMSVISALALSIILGLTVIWTKSETIDKILKEFNNIMLQTVEKMIVPILPIFIATTFAGLAYEGGITKQLKVE